MIPIDSKWILKNLESNKEFGTITALNDTLYEQPDDIGIRLVNHKDITWFVPTEKKPVKIVFEKELNHPLGKSINDSISALVDAWAALGCTSFYSDGTEVNNLKITNYTYDKPVTKITWSDGTTTKTSCNPNEADQFTGFLSAICKKLCPEYLDVYEKYTVTIPKEQAKKEAEEKERERIAEKKKAKLEKWRERKAMIKAAKELADEYERKEKEAEIEKIAVKKFGVPPAYFGKF